MTDRRQVPGENETAVRDQDKVMLRLPDGMRDKLKAAAERNRRSMNAEIVARITEYDATGLASGETIGDHIDRLQRKIKDLASNRRPTLPDGLFHRIDNAAILHNRTVAEEITQALEKAFPPKPTLHEFYEQWIGTLDVARGEQQQSLLAEANKQALLYWPDRDVSFRLDGEAVKFSLGKKVR